MKKYFILVLLSLIFTGTVSQTQAVLAPELLINDNLKECQWYSPNAKEEIINGWRSANVRFEDMRDSASKYCNSLGYTLQQNEKVASVKPIFRIMTAIFWIIFIGLAYIYYRVFLRVKKRYIVFIICFIATAIVLTVLYPFVIYQISPCASGLSIC